MCKTNNQFNLVYERIIDTQLVISEDILSKNMTKLEKKAKENFCKTILNYFSDNTVLI